MKFADVTQIYLHCDSDHVENEINLLNEDVESSGYLGRLQWSKIKRIKNQGYDHWQQSQHF